MTIGTVVVILIARVLATTFGGIRELFIPSPKSVLQAFIYSHADSESKKVSANAISAALGFE